MLLRQSEVEQRYRLSNTTLHRWLKDGKMNDHRTVGGHRRYDSAEIEQLLSVSDGVTVTEKDVALYARVSTQKQVENLTRQHEWLTEVCGERGYRIVLDCSEIASGLNDNRRQFFKIIDAACKGEVKKVVVEHRDRLTRFGFRTIEQFFKGVGCAVEVLEQAEEKGEHEELV
ncbi:IS607 family transposase [Candidatus Hakubella thermalkaliphila]|uniref:Putative resolvase n=3 Tax=Candidatus Hakubella thermalkaliphila TaxID=2754717 RepID=A0A6V8Q2S9_9ACTN|nr:IS607 family transposase [Candidatus Hakubella thermalkaliphila]GFP38803.1 putative resolvase [Candidatus Hakubella thermalkaliphila]